MDVSLLGDDGQPVARGEVGEIVVKSRYLANGYWRDPELTAERFSADLDGNGTRLVRTGDRGRINADGLLEFCGRKDDRIKIRGNRIELMDIERTLESLPGIESRRCRCGPARKSRAAVGRICRQEEQCVVDGTTPETCRESKSAPPHGAVENRVSG